MMKVLLAAMAVSASLAATPADAGAWQFSFNYSSSDCAAHVAAGRLPAASMVCRRTVLTDVRRP